MIKACFKLKVILILSNFKILKMNTRKYILLKTLKTQAEFIGFFVATTRKKNNKKGNN